MQNQTHILQMLITGSHLQNDYKTDSYPVSTFAIDIPQFILK